MPPADVIIHSGDVSFAGKGEEVMDFIEWFGGLDYKYKIFIAGNHDFCLNGKAPARIQHFLPANMYYLCASSVEIEGICFWGIPYTMSCELQPKKQRRNMAAIPANTGVLITHRPPSGIFTMPAAYNHPPTQPLSMLRFWMENICLPISRLSLRFNILFSV